MYIGDYIMDSSSESFDFIAGKLLASILDGNQYTPTPSESKILEIMTRVMIATKKYVRNFTYYHEGVTKNAKYVVGVNPGDAAKPEEERGYSGSFSLDVMAPMHEEDAIQRESRLKRGIVRNNSLFPSKK